MEEWEEPLHPGSLPANIPHFPPQRNPNCTFSPTLPFRPPARGKRLLNGHFRGRRPRRAAGPKLQARVQNALAGTRPCSRRRPLPPRPLQARRAAASSRYDRPQWRSARRSGHRPPPPHGAQPAPRRRALAAASSCAAIASWAADAAPPAPPAARSTRRRPCRRRRRCTRARSFAPTARCRPRRAPPDGR